MTFPDPSGWRRTQFDAGGERSADSVVVVCAKTCRIQAQSVRNQGSDHADQVSELQCGALKTKERDENGKLSGGLSGISAKVCAKICANK
jgi:hypothetical protein